jgi:serine/threonine protein kinase
MTETGLSLGTPHYMSPEQATAEKEITRRSDVYSLASVLYEMLTGQPAAHGRERAADHHEDHHRATGAGDGAAEVGAAARSGDAVAKALGEVAG